MEFSPITRELLLQMQNILNDSAGYAVSLADEVEYFDPATSRGWWLAAAANGRAVAFIRYFKQNDDWSLGEIYVSPEIHNRAEVAATLLEKFQTTIQFPHAHRLRFDVGGDDEEVNRTLKQNGYSEQIQIFRFFERSDAGFANSHEISSVCLLDAQEVAEVLSHLHPVSTDEAANWIKSNSVLAVRDHARIVAAAQIFESDDAIEVNRFATHEKYLRQGFAMV